MWIRIWDAWLSFWSMQKDPDEKMIRAKRTLRRYRDLRVTASLCLPNSWSDEKVDAYLDDLLG